MLNKEQQNEIYLLINELQNIKEQNAKSKQVLSACDDALQLANDVLKNKNTERYLLKITTHGGKMKNIKSISTYKLVCNTCLKLKDNKKTICFKCYADRQLKLYKQLAPALIYNTLLLKYTKLHVRQIPIINDLYFRFESFSDLQNEQHLINLYSIAKHNKKTQFALWSKNYKLLIQQKTPQNVNIVLSSPFLNIPLWSFKTLSDILKNKCGAKNVKMFTVYDKDKIKNVDQNCLKSCATCLKCYRKNEKTTYINELLK